MPRRKYALTVAALRALPSKSAPPASPTILHHFIDAVLGVEIATAPLLEGASAPFDYLVHTFFEGAFARPDPTRRFWRDAAVPAPPDCIVWAARGAGKTFLGAIATTLDLIFKPGIEIRLLGGSLEQSQRMHEHLRRFFERPDLAPLLADKITERRVSLLNGSRARILSQSQTSVRGTRVQKLRCDEVELFDPEVWSAAQLTTRSMRLPARPGPPAPWGDTIRGSVEALSTMHRPYGLMWKLVGDAAVSPTTPPAPQTRPAPETPPPPDARERVVFRWGLMDVLARCGPEHECNSCALHPECSGRAKERDRHPARIAGHVTIDDAVRMKSRVSIQVWDSEMLCLRPRRSDCVFPEFEARIHVGDWTVVPEVDAPHPDAQRRPAFDLPAREPAGAAGGAGGAGGGGGRRWIAGMDFGIRSPAVILLAWYREDDPDRVLHVEAEHVKSDWTVDQHAGIILQGAPGWPDPAPAIDWIGVDPAGNQRSEQTGATSAGVLRKLGLSVRWRRAGLHEGLDLLRSRLRPAGASTPNGQSAGSATARLFIHRRCEHLIESLTRYHYPEDRPESLDPVKGDGADHAVDALRYLVVCLDRPHAARLSSY